MQKKEIAIYLVAACTSLVILSYSVHMFVGGLVSPATERWLIIAVDAVAVVVIGFMARDVAKRRRAPVSQTAPRKTD